MTFLQPELLWGLPLILLPVIIHLINRLRHRPQPWAAMQFLLAASRSSTSHAKLRQWLILLFRVLAVLMLLLFLSRPLAGGWMGWAFAGAPDSILILLDRSPSMETVIAGTRETRRERALRMIAEAAQPFAEKSHLVLVDSALRQPQELADAGSLAELPNAAPSDSSADLPAMLQRSIEWLIDNRSGAAELWIVSDFQKANWHPEDDRWQSLGAQLEGMTQPVRVRLLSLAEKGEVNAALSLRELLVEHSGDGVSLNLSLGVERQSPEAATLPVELELNGGRSTFELQIEGASLRWNQRIPLDDAESEGWGRITLPADGNARDNSVYFVYSTEARARAVVVSDDLESGRFLRLATGVAVDGEAVPAPVLSPSEARNAGWNDKTLIVWRGPLPDGALAERLTRFAEEGGVVLCLPPGKPGSGQLAGVGWGEVEQAPADDPFAVGQWEEEDGPLATTREGLRIPVNELQVFQRQRIVGAVNPLADFADGESLLARKVLGRGQILFLASQPSMEWSTLSDGYVLVPMVQRLLQTGGVRLLRDRMIACGEMSAVDRNRNWTAVGESGRDPRVQAGVYRSGDRLIAVNRPSAEDDWSVVDVQEAKSLFAPVPVQTFEERAGSSERLQGEIWRVLLFVMLLFLLVESVLILPPRRAPGEIQSRAPAARAEAATERAAT